MQNLEIEKPGYKSNLRPTDDKLFDDMRKMATAIRGNIHDIDMLNKGVEAFPDQIADLNKRIILNKSNITRNWNQQNKLIDELRKKIESINIIDNSSEIEELKDKLAAIENDLIETNDRITDLQILFKEQISNSKTIIYAIIGVLAILTIIGYFV